MASEEACSHDSLPEEAALEVAEELSKLPADEGDEVRSSLIKSKWEQLRRGAQRVRDKQASAEQAQTEERSRKRARRYSAQASPPGCVIDLDVPNSSIRQRKRQRDGGDGGGDGGGSKESSEEKRPRSHEEVVVLSESEEGSEEKSDSQTDAELEVCIASAPGRVQARARAMVARLDVHQRRVAHGLLVVQPRVAIVSGPGGAGKSALLGLLVLLKRRVTVGTPTNGSRRAAQEVVDDAMPRSGFKPEVEVGTTHSKFGVGWRGGWDAESVRKTLKNKPKAVETYASETLVLDEAAQIWYEELDVADQVAQEERDAQGDLMGGMQLVLLLDGVQTAPVRKDRRLGAPEFIWEGQVVRRAQAMGVLQ